MFDDEQTRARRIAELNDALRKSFNPAAGVMPNEDLGMIVLTRGISTKPIPEQLSIFALVRNFNAFTVDNDPYGEHDCAILKHEGEDIMFKIDYYDKALTNGSEDPSDLSKTKRVMTLMLAHER